jgi:phosphatidylserine synthase
VMYLAYKDVSQTLAFALGALLIATGSIRHARGAAAKFDFDFAWHGMPRPVAAFIIIAFINSTLVIQVPGGRWVGVGLVVAVAVLNLVPLPFVNHHGRRLPLWGKLVIIGYFASCFAMLIWLRLYFWDVLFVCVTMYAGGSWIAMTPQERREFFAASRSWRRELSRSPSTEPPEEAP